MFARHTTKGVIECGRAMHYEDGSFFLLQALGCSRKQAHAL